MFISIPLLIIGNYNFLEKAEDRNYAEVNKECAWSPEVWAIILQLYISDNIQLYMHYTYMYSFMCAWEYTSICVLLYFMSDTKLLLWLMEHKLLLEIWTWTKPNNKGLLSYKKNKIKFCSSTTHGA